MPSLSLIEVEVRVGFEVGVDFELSHIKFSLCCQKQPKTLVLLGGWVAGWVVGWVGGVRFGEKSYSQLKL